MRSRRLVAIIAVVPILFLSAVARSDEGGVPFWLSGQYASLAAVPPKPGFYLPVLGYFFYGNGAAHQTFTRGENLVEDLTSWLPLLMIQPTYVPTQKIAGGQLALGVGFGFGQSRTRGTLSVNAGAGLQHTDVLWGITDLYPIVSLAWAAGSNNGMVYATGDVPVGSYDSKRLSNVGIGHGAADAGGAFTYLDQKKGHEASAVTGFTYNFENTSTNYKNGVDWHLDWAVSQFLSQHADVGVVGYVYQQVSGDSGSGAKLGSFESGVASVGPQFLWVLFGGLGAVNVRGYWEFWAQHRLKGTTIFASIAIPLGVSSPATGASP